MKEEAQFSPTLASNRIQAIDMIRGFAIFGIFLVNMPSFNSPVLYLESGSWWDAPLDRGTETFIDIFAQASFYTLFSFLFGFGMVMFKERAIEKGYSFFPLVGRRLLALLLFGMVHAFLIWHGDILISYAIVGAIFLLFHRTSPPYLLSLALLMIFVPSIFLFCLLLIVYLSDSNGVGITLFGNGVNHSLEVYRSGTFWDITQQRIQDWYYVNNLDNALLLILSLLPMFILGAYIAKKKWFHSSSKHRKPLRNLLIISLVIGLPIKLLPYYADKNVATEYLQDSLGGPAMAIFYATAIMLLSDNAVMKKVLSPLAAVGRLSLSNYLFQSVVCTLIFYSYGFGLYGSIRPFYGLLLTILIFIIQIGLSKLWIKYFRFGPIEWLWRSLTYNKKQPIKVRG